MKSTNLSTIELKTPKNKNFISKNFKTIAVAGNPNVGKSTVFNALTGLNQHTGNWPGKTVERAQGKYTYHEKDYRLIDIPGTYSLLSNSPEEEIARNFICFEKPDAVIVVMDATCLERNLNLTLQILELTRNVVICLNLIDEAKRKNIYIDKDELSLQLGGVPVIATNARDKIGIEDLMNAVENISEKKIKIFKIKNNYGECLESSIEKIQATLPTYKDDNCLNNFIDYRWISIRLLEGDSSFKKSFKAYLYENILENPEVLNAVFNEREKLRLENISSRDLKDKIVESIVKKAETIYKICVKEENVDYQCSDRAIDKFLTSPLTGFPTMIILLLGVFWITITGANYPSELISSLLFGFEEKLINFFINLGASPWIYGILISGIYRTLAWVVSVMLPPMAIFFPLFTLLEDVGYLPRIAFNLDSIFKKCGSHGKQALTMCMGFGCNACGVTGCRIIDSPRERLIAILTNNFVPCNGRFPILISIIGMFFIGESLNATNSLLSTLILTATIIFGVGMTFIVSKLLSITLLKGIPSSFILELPPYRKPQVGKVLIRSLLDRTIFVLGRAVAVAAPAGFVIWIMANTYINQISLLSYCSNFLDPFGRMIGLDGVILMAFILGFPANEIVFPIIIMSYMCGDCLVAVPSAGELHTLLVSHGWTYITAICVMIFSLMHFPCGTTCWTIKKETKSIKWTVLSFLLPTILGIIVCFIVSNLLKLITF